MSRLMTIGQINNKLVISGETKGISVADQLYYYV